MTLASTAGFLVLYALLFQTLAYAALPARIRSTWLPVVTGVGGAVLTLILLRLFRPHILGFAAPDATVVTMSAVGAAMISGVMGGAMIRGPRTRDILADPRVGGLSKRALAGQLLFRIPVLTALVEEAVFRGALFAALNAVYSPGVALWVSAALFGAWHVAPGFSQARAQRARSRQSVVHVLLTIVATTAAGLFLGWLRMETGSIWASFAVHASVNMTLAVFARIATAPSNPSSMMPDLASTSP